MAGTESRNLVDQHAHDAPGIQIGGRLIANPGQEGAAANRVELLQRCDDTHQKDDRVIVVFIKCKPGECQIGIERRVLSFT